MGTGTAIMNKVYLEMYHDSEIQCQALPALLEFARVVFMKPPINGNCCFMSHFSLFLGIFDGVHSNPQIHQQ